MNRSVVLYLSIITLLASCELETIPVESDLPEIYSIEPASGPKNTSLVIKGIRFSPIAVENEVTINRKTVGIIKATDTLLEVVVPASVGSGPVSVSVGGRVSEDKPDFTYIWTVSTLYQGGSIFNPNGIAIDPQGNAFVSFPSGYTIWKILPDGSNQTVFAGKSGDDGFVDGTGINAQFEYPGGVAMDADKYLYVTDAGAHAIRKISPSAVVTTLAGDGTSGFVNGTSEARFSYPQRVAVDSQGNVYVADAGNEAIRKITPEGVVSTIAGTGTPGYAEGNGQVAQFNNLWDLALDNEGNIYATDVGNHRIRKITPQGLVSTFAGTGDPGHKDGAVLQAQFDHPAGIAIDNQGNIFVSDKNRHRIRMISKGMVSTIAGSGEADYVDAEGLEAKFNNPDNLTFNAQGAIFVLDDENNNIRKMD